MSLNGEGGRNEKLKVKTTTDENAVMVSGAEGDDDPDEILERHSLQEIK